MLIVNHPTEGKFLKNGSFPSTTSASMARIHTCEGAIGVRPEVGHLNSMHETFDQ